MPQTLYELFSWNTPNGQKIVIALEEAAADYAYHPIDISKGEQQSDSFRSISPDGKIPALFHHAESRVTIFESGAILLYLAKQFPTLNGTDAQEQAQVMAWTFWQAGQLGPLAGQFGRFHTVVPENPAAVDHFEQLVWRCLDVMEKRLGVSAYLAGGNFTVADIASLPWIASEQSYLQRYGLDWRERYPSVKRWADQILTRHSVKTALQLK